MGRCPQVQELEVIESSGLGLGNEQVIVPKTKKEKEAEYEKKIDPLIQELMNRQAGTNMGLKALTKNQRAALPDMEKVDFGAARLKLKRSPTHMPTFGLAT